MTIVNKWPWSHRAAIILGIYIRQDLTPVELSFYQSIFSIVSVYLHPSDICTKGPSHSVEYRGPVLGAGGHHCSWLNVPAELLTGVDLETLQLLKLAGAQTVLPAGVFGQSRVVQVATLI